MEANELAKRLQRAAAFTERVRQAFEDDGFLADLEQVYGCYPAGRPAKRRHVEDQGILLAALESRGFLEK